MIVKSCASLMALVLALCVASGVLAEPVRGDFDRSKAEPILVVAKVALGGVWEYVEPECPRGSVCLNMDGAPYWLKLDEVETLDGRRAPGQLEASAVDHYGAGQFEGKEDYYLLPLLSGNGQFVKLRNAHLRLVRSKAGELYVVRRSAFLPSWLPCGLDTLHEDLDAGAFDDTIRIGAEDFAALSEKARTFYRRTGQGAVPRHAISLVRLRAYLDETVRAGRPLSCDGSK